MRMAWVLVVGLALGACQAAGPRPGAPARTATPIPADPPRPVAVAPLSTPAVAAGADEDDPVYTAVAPLVEPIPEDIPERRMSAETAPDQVLRALARRGGTVTVNRPEAGPSCRLQVITSGAVGLRVNPIDCLGGGFETVRAVRLVGGQLVASDADGREIARLSTGGGLFAWAPAELAPPAPPTR